MGLRVHKVPQFKKSSTVVASPGLDQDAEKKISRKPSKSNNHVIGIWSTKDQVPSERPSEMNSSEDVSMSVVSGSVSMMSPQTQI